MDKLPCTYMLASRKNGTLYVGVTSDPIGRIWQHKNSLVEGFTRKYGVHCLVWFELHADMLAAITREKQTQEMEPGVENRNDREDQSRLARSVARFDPGALAREIASPPRKRVSIGRRKPLDPRFRGGDGARKPLSSYNGKPQSPRSRGGDGAAVECIRRRTA